MAGDVGWVDLTVEKAEDVRDFYAEVIGWTSQGLDMGGYDDFSMCGPDGVPQAGVCHARGENEGLPPVWMVYFGVEDLDAGIAATEAGGGAVLRGPRGAGGGRYAVIRDPAGAVCALFEPGE